MQPMTGTARVPHPSVDQRRARGRKARDGTPLPSHMGWAPAADRRDPVALLQEQDASREPDLVPVRHGRMMVSPFTFYRGAAKVMAADLEGTPTAGLDVQLCGDAHLSNFGLFASPERLLLFDLNDFDETLPGPFEYDVKRLAASFTIAGRNNGLSRAEDDVPRVLRAAEPAKSGKGAKAARQAGKTARREAAKARDPRQPAGAEQARRAHLGPLPDRQPAADHRPGPRSRGHLRHPARQDGAPAS
jgi:hypothetical protein